MKEITSLLIKQVKVVDSGSEHHLKTVDVFIKDNTITQIGNNLSLTADEVIEGENLHLSPGWFDLRANFRDPGTGDAEDFNTGASAAIAGGFTAVGLSPDTEPTVDRKSDIERLYQAADDLPLQVFPFGSISQGLEGKELSEMVDLYEAGAVGFSHGQEAIDNPALLKLALLYTREFAPPLHLMPFSRPIRAGGVMHEGAQSTYLGLKGIPALAEELGVVEALHLATYTQANLHLQGLSAAGSLALLKQAQKENGGFTADVNLANLVFTDEDLAEYNTNLKVYPPLRSAQDKEALIAALADGTLSIITSNHQPHAIEAKRCEFDQAAFGAAGLETFFGALWPAVEGKLSLSRVIECIAINPRKVLGLEVPQVAVGQEADFTLFNPNLEYRLSTDKLESLAANNPYVNLPLKGKAIATLTKGALVFL